MLIDLINRNDYLNININLIRVLGLKSAVYISVLLSICERAYRKNKLINECYFKVDRAEITRNTTVSKKEQLIIDKTLQEFEILCRDKSDDSIIALNIEKLISIIAEVDDNTLKVISSNISTELDYTDVGDTKKDLIIKALKKSIAASNEELHSALESWIDSIYAKPNGFLSKEAVKVFEDTLNGFARGDLDVALEIIKTAISFGYKDCTWAINTYEKTQRMRRQNDLPSNAIRVTAQKTADINQIKKDFAF